MTTPMLETVSGELIDLANPDPASIKINDIAWGLSRIPRFCGHTITEVPYSVAQHSIAVANQIPVTDRRIQMLALLHDAAEVYTGDIPSPIKRIPELRPILKKIEHELMMAIYTALNIAPPTEEEERIVKYADSFMQRVEAWHFMPSRGKHWEGLPEVSILDLQEFKMPMTSAESYREFLKTFEYYNQDKD